MKALIIAEHADSAVELSAGARGFSENVTAVVVGKAQVPSGIADVAYHVSVPEGSVADDADATLVALAEEADVVLVEPTRRMKSISGKLAARFGTSVITDALSLKEGVAVSMYFGGVALLERKPIGDTAFYTVGAGVFDVSAANGSNEGAEELAWVAPAHPIVRLESQTIEKSGVDLTRSDTVVACGRGFSSKEDLQLAFDVAEKMGAGVGCTRPLAEGVDWFPSEAYIGVSGLMLAPKTYLALGISGQMQHMVGCNRADRLFAVNKDKNAPVFKQCDVGLVGDVKTVLPVLLEALK